MRRRLSKKRRLGVFQEFGFRVRIVPKAGLTDAERNSLLWEGWVLEFVEGNRLECAEAEAIGNGMVMSLQPPVAAQQLRNTEVQRQPGWHRSQG